MKIISIFWSILFFTVLLSFSSCTDNDLGAILQPDRDKIVLGTDTFCLSTEQVNVNHILSKTRKDNTLLLGSYYDTRYGYTHGDILAQFNCPEGLVLPSNIQPDSLVLAFSYSGWAGVTKSPVELDLYKMNLSTFADRGEYYSDINPALYTDKSIKLGKKIIVAKDAGDSIRFQLGNSLMNEFVSASSSVYANYKSFENFFKGVYLTSDYGSSAMLYVTDKTMMISLYYHFEAQYVKSGETRDTVLYRTAIFPANKEVRQVNRFVHSYDTENFPTKDSVDYLKAPAGIFTKVTLPIKRMKDKLKTKMSGKKIAFNSAVVNVQVADVDTNIVKLPKHLLLLKESELESFFNDIKLPDDSTSILAQYNADSNSYVFDMKTYIAKAIKNNSLPDNDVFYIVPASVLYVSSTSTTVASVEHDIKLHALSLWNKNSKRYPLRISLLYSGY